MGKIKQNFTTWLLWVALDSIALAATIRKDGNIKLLTCYVVGGTIATFSLYKNNQFKWTKKETAISLLVLDCMVVWYTSGPIGAIITSTLATCIAGILQALDSWDEPSKEEAAIYAAYTIANILSLCAARSWNLEEWFYYAGMTLLCTTIALTSLRKKIA